MLSSTAVVRGQPVVLTLAEGILVNRGELDEVSLRKPWGNGGCIDLGNEPLPTTHFDELPGLVAGNGKGAVIVRP